MVEPIRILSGSELKFIFTEGFDGEILANGSPGPQRRARLERSRIKLQSLALGVQPKFSRKPWLRADHITDAAHIRAGYPPRRLGAFLRCFEAVATFPQIPRLNDDDPKGWIGFFHGELTALVLYSDLPKPFLAFLSLGERKPMLDASIGVARAAKVSKLLRTLRTEV
jgi:hypothetical protein